MGVIDQGFSVLPNHKHSAVANDGGTLDTSTLMMGVTEAISTIPLLGVGLAVGGATAA